MTANAVMGQYLKGYKPVINANSVINSLVTRPRRAFQNTAIIVRQKEYPDVSFYQENIDWDIMRNETDAVIIRAGQNTWEDPRFRINWAKAKLQHILRGVYWFYDDRIDPGRQAALLVNLIQYDLPEMEVWCDWENSYNGSFGSLQNVVAFMQAVERALPTVWVGMYTGYYWFRSHSNAVTNAAQYNYLRNRPLWLAWYTTNATNVLIPAPWTSLDLWQYGTPAIGEMYGVQTAEIDMNVFNGTEIEFYSRYGGTQPEPPQEEPEPMQYRLTALAGLNIRNGAGTGYAVTVPGGIRIGDVIEATERQLVADGAYWYKLSRLLRAGVSQPLPANPWASAGANGTYMRLDATLPDEPVGDKVEIYVNGVLRYTVTGMLTVS